MSSLSGPSAARYEFGVVRRGYRPDRVDAFVEALSRDRDAAWERAARLTVLAREMDEELGPLREAVAALAPQTYESLGEGARRLFASVCEEAEAVRESGRREAERLASEAEAEARRLAEAAREYADGVLAKAEERAGERLRAAREEADEVRIAARREVKAGRGEALAAVRDAWQAKADAELRRAVEVWFADARAALGAGE